MLDEADKELWSGCKKVTQLSIVARLSNIKLEYHIPEKSYDAIFHVINDVLPEENSMVGSLYESKKLIQVLRLPEEMIKCCRFGCMIYWRGDKDLYRSKFCNADRYKRSKNLARCSRVSYKRIHHFPLTPRLKRLYASQATTASMQWHSEDHGHDAGVMCHPSDSGAWKHFDKIHPTFAAEIHNVRLGLSTNGFAPHREFGKKYSSWPIIITSYNLPLSMCMKEPYMFLTALVPGPSNPKHKIDVFLQPIVAELEQLLEEGVVTYDISLKQNSHLRVALMWTISDFPTHAMLSGWSTAGKLSCPHCRKHTQAFRLKNGNKMSWFDCHKIFLLVNYPYRKDKNKFNRNHEVTEDPPPGKNGEQTLREIEQFGLVKVTELNANDVSKACGDHG
ncbi:uncharacterized protein LOC111908491 [Lactuca sativa]|uniref:uncharacterized protein LOC111908491 n=1 Tax=Lactuca sativa TaxID=4236 RepID=UPI000CD80B98|nr:uncharacterized protein LOC111908491 [Lactuca sativa]